MRDISGDQAFNTKSLFSDIQGRKTSSESVETAMLEFSSE